MNFTFDLNDKMFHRGLESKADVRAAVFSRTGSVAFRESILEACREDPLLFLNLFGYVHDPRKTPSCREFLLYPYQEDAARRIMYAITWRDIRIAQSADMGVSWLNAGLALWMFLFRPGTASLFVTKTERYLSSNAPWGVAWKLSYMFSFLPHWMKPFDSLYNNDEYGGFRYENTNGSVIYGEAECVDVSKGNRVTAIFLEDAGSFRDIKTVLQCMRDTTNTRIISGRCSGSESSRVVSSMKWDTIVMAWSDHPEKSVGLYRTGVGKKLHIFDRLGYPDDYEPILDGKLRSIWYDRQCRSSCDPEYIRQELDIEN